MRKFINKYAKKSVSGGLFIVLCLFLFQCKREAKKDNIEFLKITSDHLTKITGYIYNRDFYPNTKDLTIYLSHISGLDRVSQITTPINPDNTFCFEIDLSRAQDVTMPPYLDFLYLLPGDSLHIELDFKKLLNIRLSGGRSVEINKDFYNYFNTTFYRNTDYRVGTQCEIDCTWDEIRKIYDDQRNLNYNRRKAFLQKNHVCNEVVWLTNAMIELDYYTQLMGSWARCKNAFYKEVVDQQTIMKELNEVAEKYFNSPLYSNSHFKFIASAYSPTARDFKQISNDVNYADWAKGVAQTDTIRNFMLAARAGYALLSRNLEYFEELATHIDHEYLLDRLTKEYIFTKAKMENPEKISSYILGNPKDFFRNISLDKNFLAKAGDSNYGKVQVINIGAAWCAPCKPVLEQLVTLMKEYSDKDVCVSFICVSGDNKETRAMYREKGIDDSFIYFTTNEESTFLNKTFSPFGLPYGILVNRKGVIVDYGTHVRPSENLREKINLLLGQDNLIK